MTSNPMRPPADGVGVTDYSVTPTLQRTKAPGAGDDLATGGNEERVRSEITRTLGTLTSMGAHHVAREVASAAVSSGLWENPMQRPAQFVPGLTVRAVHDPADFWFAAHLKQRYPRIRAELDRVLADTPVEQAGFAVVDENLTGEGRWEQIIFYEGGQRFDAACARFPVLTQAMAAVPEATTQGPGVVCLSWLHPGTHIKPHCGRSNAYLRVHLALHNPGGSRIRIGDETHEWHEGELLIFDDSFEHEVWHEGDTPRVVLLFDIWNPELDQERRNMLIGMRPDVTDRINAFLVERSLSRIETAADSIRLIPNDRLDGLIRRYMDQTRSSSVELRDGDLVFDTDEPSSDR